MLHYPFPRTLSRGVYIRLQRQTTFRKEVGVSRKLFDSCELACETDTVNTWVTYSLIYLISLFGFFFVSQSGIEDNFIVVIHVCLCGEVT